MNELELKEEYAKANGWEKVDGFRITTESIDTDYDVKYFFTGNFTE